MQEVSQRRSQRRWRLFFKLALFVLFIFCANYFANWFIDQFDSVDLEITPSNEHIVHRIIMASVVLYAILIAIPFVPGIEIGLALILVLGADLAFLVYLFTILGLSFSFFIGRLVPQSRLQKLLEALSLTKAGRLVAELEPLDMEQRLVLLFSHAPSKIIPILLRYRYVAVAVALNIPGNAVIGGGGGISLMTGMSRLFTFTGFLITLAIAVSPVPLLIAFFGTDIIR